jgi:hypothetical protein
MGKKINRIQAEKIVEKSIFKFGLRKTNKTNPKLIKEIIQEFKLDDFKTKNKIIKKFFDDSSTKPQDLESMINCIKKNIVLKHPAIVEFLEHAIDKKWLQSSPQIIKSLHVTYILEALTVTMCNDHNFFIEVQDHYKNKEKQRGIDPLHPIRTLMHVFRITHKLFPIIKALSVDPAMIYFRTQRGFSKSHLNKNEAKRLLKNKKINYLEYRLLSPIKKNSLEQANELLKINIYEAGIAEYKNGMKSNAICAHELNEDIKKNPPFTLFKKKKVLPNNIYSSFYKAIITKENFFPTIELSQDWVSLYITWNMAFVINNVNDWDILLPKLLIPSIIGSESENFIGARIISLWLTVNHGFYRTYDKKSVSAPKNKNEMAKAWGEINKKYAFDLAKKETHEDPRMLIKTYNKFFSHPFFNWLKLVIKL